MRRIGSMPVSYDVVGSKCMWLVWWLCDYRWLGSAKLSRRITPDDSHVFWIQVEIVPSGRHS